MESSPPETGASKDVAVPSEEALPSYDLCGTHLAQYDVTHAELAGIRETYGGVFLFPVKEDTTLPPAVAEAEGVLVLQEGKLVWLPQTQTVIPPGFGIMLPYNGGHALACYTFTNVMLNRSRAALDPNLDEPVSFTVVRNAVEHHWDRYKPRPAPPPRTDYPPPAYDGPDYGYICITCTIICCYTFCCCCGCRCCRDTSGDFRGAFP